MFTLPRPGAVALVTVDGGTMVAQLKSIIPADPKVEAGQYDSMRAQLSQVMTGDALQEYGKALEKDLGVSINMGLIDQQFQK
jgi:hypothetical protein